MPAPPRPPSSPCCETSIAGKSRSINSTPRGFTTRPPHQLLTARPDSGSPDPEWLGDFVFIPSDADAVKTLPFRPQRERRPDHHPRYLLATVLNPQLTAPQCALLSSCLPPLPVPREEIYHPPPLNPCERAPSTLTQATGTLPTPACSSSEHRPRDPAPAECRPLHPPFRAASSSVRRIRKVQDGG